MGFVKPPVFREDLKRSIFRTNGTPKIQAYDGIIKIVKIILIHGLHFYTGFPKKSNNGRTYPSKLFVLYTKMH